MRWAYRGEVTHYRMELQRLSVPQGRQLLVACKLRELELLCGHARQLLDRATSHDLISTTSLMSFAAKLLPSSLPILFHPTQACAPVRRSAQSACNFSPIHRIIRIICNWKRCVIDLFLRCGHSSSFTAPVSTLVLVCVCLFALFHRETEKGVSITRKNYSKPSCSKTTFSPRKPVFDSD